MEINWSNRALSEETRTQLSIYALASFETGKKPIQNEFKTDEETDLISRANHAFRNTFEDLGIGYLFTEIDPNSVHFLNHDQYHSVIVQNTSFGEATNDPQLRAIIINREYRSPDKSGMIFTYLHESVHLSARNSFYYDDKNNSVSTNRLGYHVRTKSPKAKEAFLGFNEAIVDATAHEIELNNFNLLFGDDQAIEDTEIVQGTYPQELEVLDAIILGIAKNTSTPPRDVWLRFCKAQFTGDITPFKDIEGVFGSGSLVILSRLGHERLDPNLSEDERHQKRNDILSYFRDKS